MSERSLFVELIPQIAEMVVEVRKMPQERYEQFKREHLEECERRYPKTLEFAKKILIVVDACLGEQGEGAADGKD